MTIVVVLRNFVFVSIVYETQKRPDNAATDVAAVAREGRSPERPFAQRANRH